MTNMMRFDQLQPGTKLELELYDNFGEKINTMLVSQIEWHEEGNTSFIAAPISEGILYPVHLGTYMDVFFLKDEHLYKLRAKVLSRDAKDNIALLKIEVKGEIEEIQRRQFFRFDCVLPVQYRKVKSLSDAASSRESFNNAITQDVSGSGVCMLVEESIDNDALLDCRIILGDSNAVRFVGSVVRLSKCNFESRYKYEVGLHFKSIDNKDREVIIKYIFNEQRKLRKKGLI